MKSVRPNLYMNFQHIENSIIILKIPNIKSVRIDDRKQNIGQYFMEKDGIRYYCM